jgi:hypothetical protein
MADLVNLYDGAYRNYALDIYEQVRVETHGADFGQTSWVTQEESAETPRVLGFSAIPWSWKLGAALVLTHCMLRGM